MSKPRATWKKAEKLKSRKHIDRVFREGKSFSLFPFKVVFLLSAPPATGAAAPGPPGGAGGLTGLAAASVPAFPPAIGAGVPPGGLLPIASAGPSGKTVPPARPPAPLQAGFGASSRNFKKAVDRNRIKRLSREAYRLQKAPLLDQLTRKGISMAVFFVFIGREPPDYATVSTKIGVALQKLLKETA